MSTNRRAVCLAVTSAGTAARCTILLNRSTKTTIPVLRLLSGGDQTQSPWKWTANTPTESVVTVVEPARRAQASRADKHRKHGRTCVPT
ncbi:hypothetical protein PF005_g27217 [Phytophthora fragariae]|uniref:Uncharacterized protein n=1 Tax=Phytophthora fragariae TaxID=53985 RepID=A0A6A3VSC3_9STRA|nr:hypothetical protein PF011_g31146 [Phytophthora fragariae]KAE9167941.1 hypothetical protein PF002_g30746 [Phytophthora fragariae]KAE9171259.1 hypothetical protein PF005_g27217 [Phytophthora fragariae]